MFRLQRPMTALFIGLVLFGQSFAQTAAPAAGSLSKIETELAAKIKIETIKDVTATLSADEMEGRGTMQAGGEKAANWLADRFKALGLKPLGDKGSYLQKIEFKEDVYTPETIFKAGEQNLKFGEDYAPIPYTKTAKNVTGDLVFIAYGIVSEAIKRNDLEGLDVNGKIVVMLDGPPADIQKEAWEKTSAKWLILSLLVRSGAAGLAVIGHGREKDSPETIIDYLKRRQLSLADEVEQALPIPPVLEVSKSGAEKLFAKSAVSLKDALAQAEKNTFKPINLNQSAQIVTAIKTTKGTSNNVVGYMEGSDPNLKAEAVLFSAHYDAYGLENGKIYHGAADNALGTAEMLAVAEAFTKLSIKPKRSLIFLAVTGEEYGLYGSKYWSKNPTWDIKKVAGNLNLDGMGTEVYGPVKTMVGYGAEHSTLGAMLADVSAVMGIKVVPDPVPDEKVFTRSDHYSFVERGVPALMLMGAPEGDIQTTVKRMEEWEKKDYHQPSDTIQPNWVWEGPKTVAEVMGIMGWRMSESEKMPEWLSTSRFAKLERGNMTELPEEK